MNIKVYSALYVIRRDNPRFPDAAPLTWREAKFLGSESTTESASYKFNSVFDAMHVIRGQREIVDEYTITIGGSPVAVRLGDAENAQSFEIVSFVLDTDDNTRALKLDDEISDWGITGESVNSWRLGWLELS